MLRFVKFATIAIKLLLLLLPIAMSVSSYCHCQTGINSYISQQFFDGPANADYFLIATLPASTSGTLDHLHLVATLNGDWSSGSNSTVDMTIGNRGGFNYYYTVVGKTVLGGHAHLVAYQQSDGSVNFYLGLTDAYDVASYVILNNMQETVYQPAVETQNATPAGTLVFDTANAAYPPASFVDPAGNVTTHGAITSAGSVGIGLINPGADLPTQNGPVFETVGNIAMKQGPAPGQGTGSGIIFSDGTIQTTAYAGTSCALAELVMPDKTIVAEGGDYAESVDVNGNRASYEPGDVMVIDPANPEHFLKSSKPYSTLVAGIYSTKPGYVGRRQPGDPKMAKTEIPMAMIGIVPTKVTTENGSIKVGDLLVTSSTSGYAMKGTDRSVMSGAIVGKALGRLDSGAGTIEVLVSVQ